MELYNGLILYYKNLHTSIVRKIILKVVSAKFRQVVISAFHVSPLQIHKHRTLFSILAQFWRTMLNN